MANACDQWMKKVELDKAVSLLLKARGFTSIATNARHAVRNCVHVSRHARGVACQVDMS